MVIIKSFFYKYISLIPVSYDLSGQSGFSRIWNGRHKGLISSENLSIGFFNFKSAMSGVLKYFWN